MPTGHRTITWTAEKDQRLVQALVYYGHITALNDTEAQRVADFVSGDGNSFPGSAIKGHFSKVKERVAKEINASGLPAKPKRATKRAATNSNTGQPKGHAQKKVKVKQEGVCDDDKILESNVDLSPSTPGLRRSSERSSPRKDYRGMDDPYVDDIPDNIADRLLAAGGEDESSSDEFKCLDEGAEIETD